MDQHCLCTALASCQFLAARIRRKSLIWRKTDHLFPSPTEAGSGRPLLGELLVKRRWILASDVEAALRARPKGVRLGEYLVLTQKLTEEDLYRALSSQAGIPLGMPARQDINRLVTRTLPAAVLRRWKVIPYRVSAGHLDVLTSELPTAEATGELAQLSRLEIRYRLIRPHQLDRLAQDYLPKANEADRAAANH